MEQKLRWGFQIAFDLKGEEIRTHDHLEPIIVNGGAFPHKDGEYAPIKK
jgi:hypothetical protein